MKKLILIMFFGIGMILTSGSYTFSDGKSAYPADQEQKKDTAVKTVYTCPMHSEIVQDKPGKCPKCGMNLTAKEVKKDVYTCPMHSEVVQDKAGKCPKCGMNLALKEPAKKTESPKNSNSSYGNG